MGCMSMGDVLACSQTAQQAKVPLSLLPAALRSRQVHVVQADN